MKKLISIKLKIILATFLFILTCSVQSTESSNLNFQTETSSSKKTNDVSVTYVGNAGFLIQIGDKKILVDALFKGFAGDYILPEQIQEKLNNAQAPFNDVDLVLVTHAHGDHISANMVQQHMKNNPKAIFASTKQTIDALNARDSLDNFNERRIGFNPSKDKSDKKEIQGITIESFLLPHGPDSRIINNGFLISVDGITFFHTGDVDFDQFTFEEFRSLQLPEKKIDLSFIQHFYLTSDSTSKQFVTKGIGGKYILPIHYHFTTPSFDAAIVKENYPDAILFNKELESWKMPERNDEITTSTRYYFNQPPPNDSAVVFAPGIFSLPTRMESNIALSPDGKECYFGVLEIKDRKVSYKIYQSKFANNKWTEPTEAPFSINNNFGDPVMSVDGKKLYLNKEGDIWMVERTIEGWGQPQLLPSPINSTSRENSYTETTDGVAYVSSRRPDGFGGIDNWRINRLPNQSLQAENLGPIMNSKYFDYSPFIAPDGSYLIFGSYRARRDGLLYISFNKGNDEWTTPINMNSCGAKVNNTTAHHSNPSLSPDGKFLFFRRHEADTIMDVYWVSTNVIKKLKEKAIQKDSSQKFSNLKGEYLGQTPPGDVPLVFAPGIISTDTTVEHGAPTFSPDGNEVFWQSNYRQTGKDTQIFGMTMRCINGQWTKPEISPYYSQQVFSLDGKRLHFIPSEDTGMEGVHFVQKQTKGWGKPIKLDLIPRFPELKYAYSLSFTKDGTVYFFGHAEGLGTRNGFAIYRAELIDGVYAKPELLPSSINMAENVLNWTPFIAPDESYLIFSSNRQDNQQGLYICFRKSDGSWTDPKNLGMPFNTKRGERFPTISPDGKYLFFTRWFERGNEDVMWVSTNFIDKMRELIISENNLSYDELETSAISHFRNNNTDSTIIILEYAFKNFPEEIGRASNTLAQVYTRTGNFSEAIKMWEIGMNNGYTYNLNNVGYQKYYKDNIEFERLAKIEKSRMDASHLMHEILLPAGFDDKKTYPILFIFHGNNRNIVKAKISWESSVMSKEFITVFLQSYIPSSPTNFNWVPNDEKIKTEFQEIYDQALKTYSVDDSKIIFAGMSAGGRKALEFTMNDDFPATGLVLNCPVIPQDISDDMITQFVENNKKIGIITGENDFALEMQKNLVSKIDKQSGHSKIGVTKGLGHSFAENFTQLLDDYLSWVIE